jgi:hypothetical protein
MSAGKSSRNDFLVMYPRTAAQPLLRFAVALLFRAKFSHLQNEGSNPSS